MVPGEEQRGVCPGPDLKLGFKGLEIGSIIMEGP